MKIFKYFSRIELILWFSSLLFITLSFCIFDRNNYLTLLASLLGATALIFCAKGNPFGQFLIIIFGILYAYISYTFSYYGEMVTYLAMTAPSALASLISWLKNPYNGNKAEVKVNSISKKETIFMLFLSIIVTIIFYFVLRYFKTANLIPSTISITTSFIAVYLTFRRSAFYALAYAATDVILIIRWILATITNLSYLSVVMCFITFLINDLYGFFNWIKMQKRQI